jgi:hypothetical protein
VTRTPKPRLTHVHFVNAAADSMDCINKLKDLKMCFDSGLITEPEYTKAKSEVLGLMSVHPGAITVNHATSTNATIPVMPTPTVVTANISNIPPQNTGRNEPLSPLAPFAGQGTRPPTAPQTTSQSRTKNSYNDGAKQHGCTKCHVPKKGHLCPFGKNDPIQCKGPGDERLARDYRLAQGTRLISIDLIV